MQAARPYHEACMTSVFGRVDEGTRSAYLKHGSSVSDFLTRPRTIYYSYICKYKSTSCNKTLNARGHRKTSIVEQSRKIEEWGDEIRGQEMKI
jgi:hypothetical protein